HHMRSIFTTSSPCKRRSPKRSIRQEKPSETREQAPIPTDNSTAYPPVFHRLLPALHRLPLVNVRVNSSRIHPDTRSAAQWNRALSAVREDGRTNNKGGKSNEEDHRRAGSHVRAERLCDLSVGRRARRDDLAVGADVGHAFASGRSLRRRLNQTRKQNRPAQPSKGRAGRLRLCEQRAVIAENHTCGVVAGRAG